MIDEMSAYDEACLMFDTAWKAYDFTSLNGAPLILWEGQPSDVPPEQGVPYIRFNMTGVNAKQGSLADESGAKKWDNAGIINVQCFGPVEWANGYEVAKYIAIMAKRVFQGKSSPNGMWFRNCRTNRIGPSGGWYQFNTLIEYQFDEVR